MTDQDLMTMDMSALWDARVAAARTGDRARVRAVEARMRELEGATRFAAMSDAELAARIAAIDGNRAPVGLLAYSPGDGQGMDAGLRDLPRLNRAIAAQQHVGLEAQRTVLLDEWTRRHGRGTTPTAPRRGPAPRPSLWRRVLRWLFRRSSAGSALANQRAREQADRTVSAAVTENGQLRPLPPIAGG